MRPADVNLQYRQNLDHYNQWEQQKRQDHETAIRNFKKRERKTGFKPPLWLVGVTAIGVVSFVGWVFITLVFSQKTLLPFQH